MVSYWMPPRGSARILIEAASPGRHLVYLHVGGYRFELEAPTPERAREIAWNLIKVLGLENVDG